jgi:hypothetical protein
MSPDDATTFAWNYVSQTTGGALVHARPTDDLLTSVCRLACVCVREYLQFLLNYIPNLFGAELSMTKFYPSCQTAVSFEVPVSSATRTLLVSLDGVLNPRLQLSAPNRI